MLIVVAIAAVLIVFGVGFVRYGLSQIVPTAQENFLQAMQRIHRSTRESLGWPLSQIALGVFLVLFGLRLITRVHHGWLIVLLIILAALAWLGARWLWRQPEVREFRRAARPILRVALMVVGILVAAWIMYGVLIQP